jgi:hypothetical protein
MQQGLHFGVTDAGLLLQACHLGVILMCGDCWIYTTYQVCGVDACATQGAAGLEWICVAVPYVPQDTISAAKDRPRCQLAGSSGALGIKQLLRCMLRITFLIDNVETICLNTVHEGKDGALHHR